VVLRNARRPGVHVLPIRELSRLGCSVQVDLPGSTAYSPAAAARSIAGLEDLAPVAGFLQLVRGTQAGDPGAEHQHSCAVHPALQGEVRRSRRLEGSRVLTRARHEIQGLHGGEDGSSPTNRAQHLQEPSPRHRP
jgi:hypothetical protein